MPAHRVPEAVRRPLPVRLGRSAPAWPLLLALCLPGLPAAAAGEPATVRAAANPASITIPDSGAATPYPSPIVVSALPGVVAKVTVTLTGLAHTAPADLDILLVGPTGQTVLLMSDAGASVPVSGVTLTVDDAAPGFLPLDDALVSGTFRPTNYFNPDVFLPPAPSGPYGAALSGFNGTNPNGTWQLFVLDAFQADSGQIAGGWSLDITTGPAVPAGPPPPGTFTAGATITVPDLAVATPYPSTLAVSGINGRVTSVRVTLDRLAHTAPADLAILLVGPAGNSVVLMGDVGGSGSAADVTLTFDDVAGTTIAPDTQLLSGVYRPSNNLAPGFAFDAPAPAGPYGSALSVFAGTNVNGTWQLFVLDHAEGSGGQITAGWTLSIGFTRRKGDFDGDGVSDRVIYRQFSTGEWLVPAPGGGTSVQAFGQPGTDLPVPGDYDGDGKTDLAVFGQTTGAVMIRRSSDGGTQTLCCAPPLGPRDVPVPGDYDGDGRTDVGVFFADTGTWAILRSFDTQLFSLPFGSPALGDLPVPGDYDGDGKTDLAVYSPVSGRFMVVSSRTNAVVQLCCADPGSRDVPIPGDYDGDGRDDLAVYRAATGQFLLLRSSDGTLVPVCCADPAALDVPVPGDYDGDGRTDLAVYRFTTGQFFVLRSSDGVLVPTAVGDAALLDLPPLDRTTFLLLTATPAPAPSPPPPPGSPPPPAPEPPPGPGSPPPPPPPPGKDPLLE